MKHSERITMESAIARSMLMIFPLLVSVACSDAKAPEAGSKTAAIAKPEPGGAPANPAADAEAKEIFASRCTPCHGPQGAGDGPASAGFNPHPANFQSPEWQASVTDEHVEQIIQYGGGAVGKSAAMPANPDLNSKPEVVSALRKYIRSLKK